MKSGDTVQILQDNQNWIYARVIVANADGSAFVQVQHLQNRQHGEMIQVAAAAIRTKADVQKVLDGPPEISFRERQSLSNQLAYLS